MKTVKQWTVLDTCWRWLVGGIEPSWNAQIQVLAPKGKQRLRLNPIKPLKAERAGSHVEAFKKRTAR